jgi:hypothetical protein
MNSANCTVNVVSVAQMFDSPLHSPRAAHTSVTSFARECHQGVLVQLAGLVVGGLKDSGASHGGFGSGDEGKVLAGDTQ